MNEDNVEKFVNALDTYAAALQRVRPSSQLDARIQAAIDREMSTASRWSRAWRKPVWAKPMWAVAAGSALVVAIVAAVILTRETQQIASNEVSDPYAQDLAPTMLQRGEIAVLPAGGISLWPTEATVFRVGGTFGPDHGEQQFWLDVRVANDGSMRIERVVAADGSELFAQPVAGD